MSQMKLPESLYALIGEFSLNFPKLDKYQQNQAKKDFARNIASSYEEYSEILFKEVKIPFFPDFKEVYKNNVSELLNNATKLIKKHRLNAYKDVIMENFSLSIPKILNVVEFCYSETQSLEKACNVYCKLAYPGYEDRYGNEDYLLNLILQWTNFAKSKGTNKNEAQFELLFQFIQIDSEEGTRIRAYNVSEQKGIWNFFPFSVESVSNLVDYVLRNDTFFSPIDYCKFVKENTELIENINDFEDRIITPDSICRFIIKNDRLDNPNIIIHTLASYMEISKYSSLDKLNKVKNIIANRLEYVCSDYPLNSNNSQGETIFCVKLVETALKGVFEVKIEDDIEKVIQYIFINNDKKPQKLKLNSFVAWEKSAQTGELELVEKSDFYKYGDETLDSIPSLAIFSNYYSYLFNKANNATPFSLFMVCAYSKWLSMNYESINNFIPELSQASLKSVLLDYAIKRYGSMCPIPEEYTISFTSNLNFEEIEIVDIMYDLKEKRSISNYELVDLWKYLILNTELVYRNGEFKDCPNYLNVREQEYVETGKLFLPWKYVRYVDSKVFFYHPNHEKGINAILPFIHKSEKSKKKFSDLNKRILWWFPPLECECVKGQIVQVDEDFVNYVLLTLNQKNNEIERREKIYVSFNGVTAKEILLKYKSLQLSFLESKQLSNYQIIPIGEKFYSVKTASYREEPSLLFTIGKNGDLVTLVYENVFISRASYIFIIKSAFFETGVKRIKNYFTSDIPNKRSELQFSREMFSKSDGILRVIRVIHDDLNNWESTMCFYAKNF